jgi:hypothetical protein
MKFPIDKFPVELRVKVYELAIITTRYNECFGIPWSRTIYLAGVLNDLDALEVTVIQGFLQREIICPLMALTGNLPALKWARTPAQYGHELVNAEDPLSINSCILPLPWSFNTCMNAARGGHLHILKWARAQNCPWDSETCAAAAEGGHLKVLMWLHKQNCPWDERTCADAASEGHLMVLKWLHEQQCPWNDNACSAAVESGHLEVLQWLHEHGCPWDNSCTALAAYRGDLEMLQWLHEKRCPWDESTTRLAYEKGYYEVMDWAIEHGCPCELFVEDTIMDDHFQVDEE